jgi:hypothetical protein
MGHRFFIEHEVVAGGEERYHSVNAGLAKVTGDPVVAVHDGVRPVGERESHRSMFRRRGRAPSGDPRGARWCPASANERRMEVVRWTGPS